MNNFIDDISMLSTIDDLYAYSKSMVLEYIDDKDVDKLKFAEKLAVKIIKTDNSIRAFDNYFFVLANSGQYGKIYKICLKLLEIDKFKKFALDNLSDYIFVQKGYINNEEWAEILNKRLELSDKSSEKEYIISLLNKINDKQH